MPTRQPNRRRSNCPIAYSLDLLGDAWSLLIVRDIVFAGKRTFGEFLASDEGIATNILSNRLSRLEQRGILKKRPHPRDKRKDLYELTDAGLELVPILLDLAAWGAGRESETAGAAAELLAQGASREEVARVVIETVRAGGSVFDGPDSALERLRRGT